MNMNKKDNNGWILCPSKRLSGKFYYFNVLNGETAWSLNETDHQLFPKDNGPMHLHRADKSHTYPEPIGAPEEPSIGPNFTPFKITRQFTNIPQTTQMFGQPPYPTYISNVDPYMQNIVWMPMYPPNPRQRQITQPPDPLRDVFVQTCNVPLSKRFINFEEPKPCSSTTLLDLMSQYKQNTNDQPKVVFRDRYVTSQTYAPITQGMSDNQPNSRVERRRTHSESDSVAIDNNEVYRVTSTQMFDPIIQNSRDNDNFIKKVGRQRTVSESDSVIFEKPNNYGTLLNLKPKDSINTTESLEKEVQSKNSFVSQKQILNSFSKLANSTLMKSTGHIEKEEGSLWSNEDNLNKRRGSSMDNLGMTREIGKDNLLDKLDKNDLRYTLVQKRRKSADLGCFNSVEGNTFKVPDSKQYESKKKVTFDLKSSEPSFIRDQGINKNTRHPTINSPSDLADGNPGVWYIVVDTDVLLTDFQLIEKFAQLEENCKLLIPQAVKAEVEAYCFGDCRGQQRVIVARQLTRRFHAPPPHIVVEPVENEEKIFMNMSTMRRILNCCLNIVQQNIHVVLITDNSVLCEEAESLKLHCYSLKQIKNGATIPQTDASEALKITVNNKGNSYLENETSSSPNEAYKVPIDCYKRNLFEKKNYDDGKTTRDANTSPINFGETIGNRREKSGEYLNFNYDSDSATSQLSLTMEQLKLKEKNTNKVNKKPLMNNNVEKNSDSFVFQIKNKRNILPLPQKSQLQNSKKESVFDGTKSAQFQIQKEQIIKIKNNKTKESMQDESKRKIEGVLKNRFDVPKNSIMESNLKSNIEEWTCTFRQIMEYAMTSSLLEHRKSLPSELQPPWSLHEAVTCINHVYQDTSVCTIADELSQLIHNQSCSKGELRNNMAPEEFMRVFGYGVLLLEALHATHCSFVLTDAQELLTVMLATLQRPPRVDDLQPAPAPARGGTPHAQNYVKRRSDIVRYLKKHFPQWENYSEPISDNEKAPYQNTSKIVRTCGRNLNLLTIDKTKSMTLKEPTDNDENSKLTKSKPDINISENTLVDSQSTVKLYDTEPKIIRLFDSDTQFPKRSDVKNTNHINVSPKHGNTFGDSAKSDGPKVVRNIKPIAAFEEKLKPTLDEDALDYTPIEGTLPSEDAISHVVDEEDSTNDKIPNNERDLINDTEDDFDLINDEKLNENTKYNDKAHTFDSINDKMINDKDQINDSLRANDSSTNDSGFENESDTYILLQTFLCELSGSIQLIYKFVDNSVAEFRDEHIHSDRKKNILDKATTTHGHLTGIIYKLESIVHRESNERTPLKEIILKADLSVIEDKRMLRYRQVVMKLLEQAYLLERALRILLGITEGEYDVTVRAEPAAFLNIFE